MMGHQLTVLIVNGMTKYYDKEFIGAAIVEAIKFCVACLPSHFDTFTCGIRDTFNTVDTYLFVIWKFFLFT